MHELGLIDKKSLIFVASPPFILDLWAKKISAINSLGINPNPLIVTKDTWNEELGDFNYRVWKKMDVESYCVKMSSLEFVLCIVLEESELESKEAEWIHATYM